MTWLAMLLAAATVVFSPIAFVAVGLDKRRATLRRWRLRENTLHMLELLGGWPGSLVGRRVFRHKTRDTRYRIKAGLIVALHVAAWIAIVLFALRDALGGAQG